MAPRTAEECTTQFLVAKLAAKGAFIGSVMPRGFRVLENAKFLPKDCNLSWHDINSRISNNV